MESSQNNGHLAASCKVSARPACTYSPVILVELAGVEPASESALTETSPGADGYCGLSSNSLAMAQTVTRSWLGSFIIHGAGKAWCAHVLH